MTTRRELLELLREELTARVEDRGSCENENHGRADNRELPAIARELRMVLAELDGIPEAGSKAPADEIARKRQERRQQAAARAAAEG